MWGPISLCVLASLIIFYFFVLLKATDPIPHLTLCALLSEFVELFAKSGLVWTQCQSK